MDWLKLILIIIKIVSKERKRLSGNGYFMDKE